MCMDVEQKTPENMKIFVPMNDIKDDLGCIDEMFSGDIKSELSFPEYTVPNGISKEEYFEQICQTGLKERYGDNVSKEILERYEKEKSAIIKFNCIDIFLHYHDIVELAKNNNIMIGTGRGSEVGSLVCYILGITNVDPIKYNFFFERFLNSERFYLPDIELDIEAENSDTLIELIFKKYGNEHIAIAFHPSYSSRKEDEGAFKTILFVSENPIKDSVPVDKIAPDTYLTIEPYKVIAKSSCLRLIINHPKVLNRIKKSGININEIPLNDEKVFSLFETAQVQGIFQLNGFDEPEKDLLQRLKPQSIEELSAFYALERPAPIDGGLFNLYINAKYSPNNTKYDDLTDNILKETYGEIIYQEQIMQILNIIGGFELSKSDIIRRNMAKQISMPDIENTFIENAKAKGIEYIKAKELWYKMSVTSFYCFMKSHAIAVALLTYFDAYVQTKKVIK